VPEVSLTRSYLFPLFLPLALLAACSNDQGLRAHSDVNGGDGAEIEVEGSDLLAVCLQHEIDHLHGKLFLDHLSFLKKRSALAAWEEEKEKYPDGLRVLVPGEDDHDEL